MQNYLTILILHMNKIKAQREKAHLIISSFKACSAVRSDFTEIISRISGILLNLPSDRFNSRSISIQEVLTVHCIYVKYCARYYDFDYLIIMFI